MLSAYFNQKTRFNTLRKGATVKDSIISELKVTILEHAVVMNSTFTGMRTFFPSDIQSPGQGTIILAFLLETQIRDIKRG